LTVAPLGLQSKVRGKVQQWEGLINRIMNVKSSIVLKSNHVSCYHGRNFVAKCRGTSWCETR